MRIPRLPATAENKYLTQIKETVTGFFKGKEVKVILFGSRARGENDVTSDVDIGFLPTPKFDTRRIPLLEEQIDALNVPYKVEIVNLLETSSELREQALRDGIVWKDY